MFFQNFFQYGHALAWENSRHLATPPLVSQPNDVWEAIDRRNSILMTQIWVVLLIGWINFPGGTRLRAVSLFSVVRRAKRETRKWPRAWLMITMGCGSEFQIVRCCKWEWSTAIFLQLCWWNWQKPFRRSSYASWWSVGLQHFCYIGRC